MLKLYHAEPAANSLKALISMKEKRLDFESAYVDLHKFEQHDPAFLAVNPEGQVPVLVHDGHVITHSTIIAEYLEDAFPGAPPLRPADPFGKSRVRYWNKFVDEQVMEYVSMHGWHRMVTIIARSIESGEFDQLMSRIPLPRMREKWMKARSGFGEAELANATQKVAQAMDKVEAQLALTPWLAGHDFSIADINFFSVCGMALGRLFPMLEVEKRAPRLTEWVARMHERPGVKAAFAMPNRTNPALRTFTGEA